MNDPKLITTLKANYQVKSLADPFVTFVWLDTVRDKSPYVSKTPNPLKNKLVRQAIYKAVDINKVISGASLSARPASQLVTDAIFGFNPDIKRAGKNIDEAKKLMEQAGVAAGFEVTLDVIVGGTSEEEAGIIAKELAEINIKVKIGRTSEEEFYEKWLVKRDTSAFLIDYGAETFDAGEMFVNVLHTPVDIFGTENLTNYSNANIDKLAEEIASTFDAKTRQEKLQSAMLAAMEEVPMVPLYNKEFSYILRNDVDWTPTAFGAIYADEMTGRQVIN